VNRKKLISIFSYLIGIIILIFVYSSSFSLIVFAQTLPPPSSSSTTSSPSKSYTSTNGTHSSLSANISDLKSPPVLNKLQTNVVPKLLEKLSSLSNVVAISTVDGIKFSGINIGDTSLSLTLSYEPKTNNSTTNNVANLSLPVTVLVSKLPINNLTEIMSMVQSSRNLATSLGSLNVGGGGPTVDLGTILSSNPKLQSKSSFSVLSLLKNVKIGIGAFVNPNWNFPQTISMGLIGLPTNSMEQTPTYPSSDIILVLILPYRGMSGIATLPLQ
jgi:hypothetical protein